jgi:hypothetical protein
MNFNVHQLQEMFDAGARTMQLESNQHETVSFPLILNNQNLKSIISDSTAACEMNGGSGYDDGDDRFGGGVNCGGGLMAVLAVVAVDMATIETKVVAATTTDDNCW